MSSNRSNNDEKTKEDEANAEKVKEEPKANVEESSKGKVQGSLFGNYLKSGSNPFVLSIILSLFVLTQAAASMIDWWVSYWTKQEEIRTFNKENVPEQDIVLAAKSTGIFQSILEALENDDTPLSTQWCIIVQGSLLTVLFFFAITRSVTFFQSAVRSSQRLHDAMFKGVISVSFIS